MKKATGVIVIIIFIFAGVFVWEYRNAAWLAPFLNPGNGQAQQQLAGQATFACDGGKNINASFYNSTTPTSTGSVYLSLSDNRTMTLPQTISADGIRYANADQSFVFWSKGNTAFITEGAGANASTTFANCIKTSDLSGQENWQTFASSTLGYSFKYPQGYTLNTSYVYTENGPGNDISGVQVTIDPGIATGTNLGNDSYLSVEQLPAASSTTCAATQFLQLNPGDKVHMLTDQGTTYSVASSTGAAAGNRYEEWAWAISGTNPCTAVRYFIHYGVLDNYPAGTVQQFNEQQLLQNFDGIRQSLVLAPASQ